MYRAVYEDVRKCSGSTAFANTVGKSSRGLGRCGHICDRWAYHRFDEELIISTRSGAPERSPAGAGDQARSQGLVP
jgi:hypothetical protein